MAVCAQRRQIRPLTLHGLYRPSRWGGRTLTDLQRLKELERENKELRRANEILKLASAFFAQAELDRRLKS